MKIVLLILSIFSFIPSTTEPDIVGVWNTLEDNTKIQIVEQNGMLVGRIKSSDNTKAVVGTLMLKDLTKTGNKWSGKIFSIKKKEWFTVDVTYNKNTIELKVYAGIITKRLVWNKS